MVETRVKSKNCWDGLRPYQREACWSALFGLGSIALIGLIVAALYQVWPATMSSTLLVTIGAAPLGLVLGVAGLRFGWRMEERRQNAGGGR